MELKLDYKFVYHCDFSWFNRTFMELKFWKVSPQLSRKMRFNRTFMELKFGKEIDNIIIIMV